MTAPGTPSAAASAATAGVGSTPRRSTLTPSAARPAVSAPSRSGPERRGSRPTTKRSPPSTRAAARPRASTSSGVSSSPTRPRTPSVPNRRVTRGLPLGVLRRLAGLLQAVLLALLLPGVPGEEAGPLEGDAQLRVEGHEGPGDAEAQGAGL